MHTKLNTICFCLRKIYFHIKYEALFIIIKFLQIRKDFFFLSLFETIVSIKAKVKNIRCNNGLDLA